MKSILILVKKESHKHNKDYSKIKNMKVTDKIQITNECNMELMARYPENYFELAIVISKYWIIFVKNTFYDKRFKTITNRKSRRIFSLC